MSLTYPYIPHAIIDKNTKKVTGAIYRPQVPVRISYNRKVSQFLLDCIVDSGSDTNLFPADYTDVIGINLKKGIHKEIIGIGSSKMDAYTHRVKLYLGAHILNVNVDFGIGQQVPLLGRTGFFDQFKEVTFLEVEKELRLSL